MFSEEEDKTLTNHHGGIILLTLAKAAESIPAFKSTPEIAKKQKAYAEIYEMIDKALYIHHDAIVNLPSGSEAESMQNKALNDGNKISVLGGDYLVSYGMLKLATLVQNSFVLELLGSAIDNYCVYHFNGERDSSELRNQQ